MLIPHRLGALALVLCLVGITLIAAGCSEGIRSGLITDKVHHAERTWFTVENQTIGETCVGTGANRVCTAQTIPVLKSHRRPEEWLLKLRDDEGRSGTVSVSEGTFGSVAVGQWFGEPREDPAG